MDSKQQDIFSGSIFISGLQMMRQKIGKITKNIILKVIKVEILSALPITFLKCGFMCKKKNEATAKLMTNNTRMRTSAP